MHGFGGTKLAQNPLGLPSPLARVTVITRMIEPHLPELAEVKAVAESFDNRFNED
jgi:hypothetical protein